MRNIGEDYDWPVGEDDGDDEDEDEGGHGHGEHDEPGPARGARPQHVQRRMRSLHHRQPRRRPDRVPGVRAHHAVVLQGITYSTSQHCCIIVLHFVTELTSIF